MSQLLPGSSLVQVSWFGVDDIDETLTHHELLSQPIDVLEFSTRVANALFSEQITTIGELVERTASDLLDLRNFGDSSLVEVREKLGGIGLRLRGE